MRAALRREGEAYAATGRWDRVRLVNAELAHLGEPQLDVPKSSESVPKQTRQSAQAATRRKRAE